MASKKKPNPYVHLDESKGMLNQAGSDGYSFDERDEEPHINPEADKPGTAAYRYYHKDSEAEQQAQAMEHLDKLQKSCEKWDIHGGPMYMASSEMGKNKPMIGPGDSRRYLFDTSHDLHDAGQFIDFMDARAKQANALSAGLQSYKTLLADKSFTMPGPENEELIRSFSERAVMCLYGMDVQAHVSELDDWQVYAGEAAIMPTGKHFSRMLREGKADELIDRLDGFVSGWDDIKSGEFEAAREGGAPRFDVTGLRDKSVHHAVFTEQFLERWVAEVKGREGFFDRIMACDGPVPERPGFSISGDVGRTRLKYIVDICKNEKDQLGRGQPDMENDMKNMRFFSAFDGASIVESAGLDMKAEFEKDMGPDPAFDPKFTGRHGLDAKAGEIESKGDGVFDYDHGSAEDSSLPY